MGRRLWEYNTRATIKYGCPVWSCVIYLTRDSAVAEVFSVDFPNGWAIHQFNFAVIKMWDISTEELLQTGRSGLAPLLVLIREGQRQEVIEKATALLDPPDGERKSELLMLTYGLASLILVGEAMQDWLERTFGMLYDILKDTRAFKKIANDGRLEGLQKGLQEGRQKGRREGRQEGGAENLRLAVVDMVEARFANVALAEQVREQVANIHDLEALRQLVVKVALLQNADEVAPLIAQFVVFTGARKAPPSRKKASARTSRKKQAP